MKQGQSDAEFGPREEAAFNAAKQALGQRLRELRGALGLTLEQVSERSGVDAKHLWKIEKAWGKDNLTLRTLARLALGLDCSVAELFTDARSGRGPSLGTSKASFEIVQPTEDEKYRTTVPLFSLQAASGAFSSVQAVEPEAWVRLSEPQRLEAGMFVAQVVGHSMEPTILHRAYCLFRSPVLGSRQGRIVLVQHRELCDPETGGRYTVKRYRSTRQQESDGSWRHLTITLEPLNPRYRSLVLTAESEDQVAVIAEFVRMVG